MSGGRVSRLATLVVAAAALACVAAAPVRAAVELCDGRDNDGDGSVDPGCPTACTDPRAVASEAALGAATATLGRDRVLVWDGHGFGAVWSEPVAGGNTQVFFRRLDPSGQPLAVALPVSAARAYELDAVVDWSGAGYGIAWSDEDFDLPQILFAFVSADGQRVAGPVAVSVAGQDGSRPAIAWDGDAFVVTWAWYNGRVHQRRVRPDGTFAGAPSCVTCMVANGADEIAVAPAPAAIGYAWSDGLGSVRFVRADRAGAALGPPLVLHAGHAAAQPALLWTGTQWAALWYDRRSGGEGLYLVRIDATGQVAGGDVRIDGAEPYAAQPALAWTGGEFLAGWVGGSTGAYGVRLRRLDPAGAPLAPAVKFDLATTTGFPDFRAGFAWTGARPAWLREEPSIVAPRPVRFRALDCCGDADGDGVGACDGDLDDGDPAAHPGATELCNGRDDDLDGTLDEGCDRSCEAAPIAALETRGTQADAATGLAVGGLPLQAWLARALPGAGVQLGLDRGGPPWTLDALEADPAASTAPAAAWAGDRAAVLFRDARPGTPELRVSVRKPDGSAPAFDQPFVPATTGLVTPALAWGGRHLAAGWVCGAVAAPHGALATHAGLRLVDDIALGAGTTLGRPVAIAAAPDDGGGTLFAWIDGDGFVRADRRDDHGGRRGPALLVAAPPVELFAPWRGPLAVASAAGNLAVAWSQELYAGLQLAVVRRDGTIVAGPLVVTGLGASSRDVQLGWTGAELVVLWIDERGRPTRARFDANGQRLGPNVALVDDTLADGLRAAWDGGGVRLSWTRSASPGSGTREVRTARLDCAATPVAGRVPALRLPTTTQLAWGAVEAAVYDVVSGDLAKLRTFGFPQAIDACEAQRTAATSLTLPARPLPRFWLVRAVVNGVPGTWDEDGLGQVASRDAAIAASPSACP